MILVVTHRHGFEADPVLDRLRSRGVPYFRLNTETERKSARYAIAIESSNAKIQISADGRDCDLADVRVAWFQQSIPDTTLGTPLLFHQHESFSNALEAVIHSLNCPWLNHPRSARIAANKFIQLSIARSVGLRIPETLVSNDPSAARAFAKLTEQIVAKSFGAQWQSEATKTAAAVTTPVDASWLVNDEDIEFAPVLYQRFCPRKRDYRVVVVGSSSFVAACEDQSSSQKYDVRRSNGPASYRPSTIPPTVVEQLQKLMHIAQIDYCSADFIETATGELLFVDLNVTGSWWWIDHLFDGAICSAITNLLCAKGGYERR